ncbi:hypothetical protein ACIQ9P_26915 [Kitasatospora sp. NPDC094019]|uniref:hypothetical protein n=1 Tax=Kitasatospora sp. NPDC094019 TaxID=3364091 RepID=UPI00381DEB71
MPPLDDQELEAALRDADSPAWSVRAAAGRRLAMSDRIDEVTDVLHRLLLDARDTGVVQETAVALLEREDTIGLRCVLLARSHASETWTAAEIQATLDCDPAWMVTEGADRLIERYRALATDQDPGVRDEVQRLLARLRPRAEWARDSEPGPVSGT